MIYRLSNPYHTQRNNEIDPAITCNVTAMVMALKGSGIDIPTPPGEQPEDFLSRLLDKPESRNRMKAKYPSVEDRHPREIHGMLSWVVNTKLIGRTVTQFTTKAPLKHLLWRLARFGSGAVVSGHFTPEGHMVSLAGFETTQDKVSYLADFRELDLSQVNSIFIDDPWGDVRTGYQNHNGDDIPLSVSEFNRLTRDSGNADSKWAHLISRDGNFLEGVWGN